MHLFPESAFPVILLMEEILHHLGMYKALQIMGETTNLNWLTGSSNISNSLGASIHANRWQWSLGKVHSDPALGVTTPGQTNMALQHVAPVLKNHHFLGCSRSFLEGKTGTFYIHTRWFSLNFPGINLMLSLERRVPVRFFFQSWLLWLLHIGSD